MDNLEDINVKLATISTNIINMASQIEVSNKNISELSTTIANLSVVEEKIRNLKKDVNILSGDYVTLHNNFDKFVTKAFFVAVMGIGTVVIDIIVHYIYRI